MPTRRHYLSLVLLLCVLLAISGCAGLIEGKKNRRASSVVDYLYPNREDVIDQPQVPELTLPLDVGIAFVPSGAGSFSGFDLDEKQKLDLMQRIAEDFRQHDFIRNIEFIPSAYLRPAGGFDNLDQIRTMYGVDVIALLSYDQVQYTDEGLVSLFYWTIVGAYIFEGEKNDTSTMIDAAVYDIPSRKLLIRAPGISQVKGRATFVNQSEELRADSRQGFELAADDLVKNTQAELDRFKQRIKERPDEVKIVHGSGHTGAGFFGPAFSLLALTLLGVAWRNERNRRRP